MCTMAPPAHPSILRRARGAIKGIEPEPGNRV
jgi:hypothetical protein